MKSRTSEKGSAAHIIIIVVLVLAVLGLLGYVFWQNFMASNTTTTDTTPTSSTSQTSGYTTYNNETFGVSFDYPSTWTLDETANDDTHVQLNINNDEGTQVAGFSLYTIAGGAGGTCEEEVTYNTIDVTPFTGGETERDTVFGATILPNGPSKYAMFYGLNSNYTTIEEGSVCANTVYYIFEPVSDKFQSLGFRTQVVLGKAFKEFDNKAAAEAYIDSDEYAAIKKMMLSLKY